MTQWWVGLSEFEKFFWIIALPSTAVFLIQTILSLLGMAEHDADLDGGAGHVDLSHDVPHDVAHDVPDDVPEDMPHDTPPGDLHHEVGHSEAAEVAEFRFFSVRSVIVLLAFFGWTGIAGIRIHLHPVLTVLLALAVGALVAAGVAALFFLFAKMQQSGTLDMRNAVGQLGTAYLPIPAEESGTGVVQLPVQGAIRELTAITSGPKIPTGTKVRVVSLIDRETVLVEKA